MEPPERCTRAEPSTTEGDGCRHFVGLLRSPWWALGMAAADTDAAALIGTRSDAIPAPLEWTHVAGVYDPLAGRLRIYVNGQLSTITNHASAWNATGPLQLGRSKTAGVFTGYWPGTVDDVRTYDGVLRAEQITQLAAR